MRTGQRLLELKIMKARNEDRGAVRRVMITQVLETDNVLRQTRFKYFCISNYFIPVIRQKANGF